MVDLPVPSGVALATDGMAKGESAEAHDRQESLEAHLDGGYLQVVGNQDRGNQETQGTCAFYVLGAEPGTAVMWEQPETQSELLRQHAQDDS